MINNTIKTFLMEGETVLKSNLGSYTVLEKLRRTTDKLDQEILIPRTQSATYSFKSFLQTNPLRQDNDCLDSNSIRKVDHKRPVIGIDSSCVAIGESIKGILVAIKATVVKINEGKCTLHRFGPVLVYLTNETIQDLKNILIASRRVIKLSIIDPTYSTQLAMNLIERFLLYKEIIDNKDAIILVDGSLRTSNIELKDCPLHTILNEATDRNNVVIGISKQSKLFKWCSKDFIKLAERDPPIVVEVHDAKKYLNNLLGEVYFALFSSEGIPLRVDLSCNGGDPLHYLNILYSSDLFYFGYPETLRQAHIFSKLSKAEMIGLKSSIDLCKGKLVSTGRGRDILFGAFNRTAVEWS